MTNPCETCPDGTMFNHALKQLDHIKDEFGRARWEIDNPSTPRKRRRELTAWVASQTRTLVAFYEGLLPEGGEQAFKDCHGPFERTYAVPEEETGGPNREYCERVCGARIMGNVTGMLIQPEES
jgi:hypothetical protein